MKWPKSLAWRTNAYEDTPFGDYEPEYFPFRISECPVCFALVDPSRESNHKDWHLTRSEDV